MKLLADNKSWSFGLKVKLRNTHKTTHNLRQRTISVFMFWRYTNELSRIGNISIVMLNLYAQRISLVLCIHCDDKFLRTFSFNSVQMKRLLPFSSHSNFYNQWPSVAFYKIICSFSGVSRCVGSLNHTTLQYTNQITLFS